MTFSVAPKNFFVNAPFQQLQEDLLDLFIKNNLQPEIGLEGETLYTNSSVDFHSVAEELKRNNLDCTLHAPFFDLAPGGLDRYIRQKSREKLRLAFELIPIFTPRAIVCHLSFEDNKHGYKQEEWFQHALETWQELLTLAEKHKTPLVLENTYELSPKQHILMLEALNSPFAKFCFDTGHVLAFAGNSWHDWQGILDHRLGHIHLHDNKGDRDSHLAAGLGKFDFEGFFNYLAQQKIQPTVTIEPHTKEDLWTCLDNLKKMKVIQ